MCMSLSIVDSKVPIQLTRDSATLSGKVPGLCTTSPRWQYKFATDDMMVLPSAVDMTKHQADMRGHALTLDTKRGDFYFEYVVKQQDRNSSAHNVVRFSKGPGDDGKYVGTLLNSNPILAQREPHGIKYELDANNGKEYLYHTNNGWNDSYGEAIGKNGWDDPNASAFIANTDLSSSTILWQTFLDAGWAKKNNYTKYSKTRLTDAIPLPGTDYLRTTPSCPPRLPARARARQRRLHLCQATDSTSYLVGTQHVQERGV